MKRLLLLILAVGLGFASPPAEAQSFSSTIGVQATGTGDQHVIVGAAGKSIQVYGLDVTIEPPQTLQVKCGTTTALTGAMTLIVWSKPLVQAPAYFTCPVGVDFVLSLGGNATIAGVIWYRQQ